MAAFVLSITLCLVDEKRKPLWENFNIKRLTRFHKASVEIEMRLFTFSDNNHKLIYVWLICILSIMLALRLKKVASIIRWKTQVWFTRRNISWLRCHHKSRPWSPFICVNISASMMRVITTTIRVFTLGDQASDRYNLCWTWYHTILWGDSSCDTPIKIMMMMILTCGFLYYRLYPCHAQILLLSNTCEKLILITLHVVMIEFTEFLLVWTRCHRHHWF